MNNAAVGIVNASLISLPIWALIYLAVTAVM